MTSAFVAMSPPMTTKGRPIKKIGSADQRLARQRLTPALAEEVSGALDRGDGSDAFDDQHGDHQHRGE